MGEIILTVFIIAGASGSGSQQDIRTQPAYANCMATRNDGQHSQSMSWAYNDQFCSIIAVLDPSVEV